MSISLYNYYFRVCLLLKAQFKMFKRGLRLFVTIYALEIPNLSACECEVSRVR